jgi:hypothetical protein
LTFFIIYTRRIDGALGEHWMQTSDAHAGHPPLSELVFGDGTPQKAFYTALAVGSILTLINHGDQIIAGNMPPLLKVALTYCVPYCVTTWGAVTGKRARLNTTR